MLKVAFLFLSYYNKLWLIIQSESNTTDSRVVDYRNLLSVATIDLLWWQHCFSQVVGFSHLANFFRLSFIGCVFTTNTMVRVITLRLSWLS